VTLAQEKTAASVVMKHREILDSVNRRTYAGPKVVSWYDRLDSLLKPEQVILDSLTPLIRDRKLLDIGIGGGRTTKFLLEISKDYTGIDYTSRCVEIARNKYPGANILCCDARDLSVFSDGTFDFVLFAFNGIDYIAHEDRITALNEIRRVLKPGSPFMFSTHNRDYKHIRKLPWQEGIQYSLGFLKSCLYTFAHLPRHFMMKKHERCTDEYAIVNDTAHGFSLLAYYIGVKEQISQLKRTGFTHIEVYDMNGARIVTDAEFPWTYYLARKAMR
jgi:ubiquinone/menaquinone biosynthesis C-methylase UbiE